MMQIKCLSNSSYSLKSCHNPFGKGFQPPAPYGQIPVEHLKSLHGASLLESKCSPVDFSEMDSGAKKKGKSREGSKPLKDAEHFLDNMGRLTGEDNF